MDITLFFDDDAKQNQKGKTNEKVIMAISKSKINEYLKILIKLYDAKKISDHEHNFMIKYIRVGGTIINIGKFVNIVNRVNNEELINFCYNTFDKFFSKPKLNEELDKELINKNCLHLEYVEKINEIVHEVTNENDSITFTNDQINGIRKVINFTSNNN